MIHRFVLRDRRPIGEERLLEVLKGAVVTERSTYMTQDRRYTFHVVLDANKFEIKRAVELVFGVKVSEVNTLRLPGKVKRFRGIRGKRSPVKKAIVKLAEGQVLDLSAGAAA
jgi:large subunit ribosomal protein L23